MRINKYLILFVTALLIMSCAHRSGHNKRERKPRPSSISGDLVANKSTGGSKMDGAEIFKKYSNAVFMIFTTDGNNVYQGSGFFIGDDGLAVSNYHVFKGTTIGDEAIKMPGDDTAYKVTDIYQRSEEEDFIIFRVDYDNTSSIPIADKKPQIGDKVFAIGSPQGLENTFSSGEVSQWRGENLMQISALIDHGSSGGALINEYGEVVGITSGSFADGSQANLNYAWSIDAIKPYVK
jgi:serine protease Do